MLFTQLITLKKKVDAYNKQIDRNPAVFHNPHMFSDGHWAVAIIFGYVPEGRAMADILEYTNVCCPYSFFGVVNGKITLFVQ